jgi:hypothetical protein
MYVVVCVGAVCVGGYYGGVGGGAMMFLTRVYICDRVYVDMFVTGRVYVVGGVVCGGENEGKGQTEHATRGLQQVQQVTMTKGLGAAGLGSVKLEIDRRL